MRAFRFTVPAGDAAVACTALGAAWALKAFYSAASFEQLRWILTPTVWLIRACTGVPFELERHVGYMNRDQLFLVAPACAGVNFMIVAFVSLCLALADACSTAGARVALVAGSAAAAYAVTVLANATRIALAVRMHEAGPASGPMTPARLHCAEGVVVYFLFLLALLAAAAWLTEARREPAC